MHPILFNLGSLPVYSYGFMLALAFLSGAFLTAYRARKVGIESKLIAEITIYIFLSSVIGGKILGIATNYRYYWEHAEQLFQLQRGFAFYGGLFLPIVVVYCFLKVKKLKIWQIFDLYAPSIALGIGLTRVGCFLAGCCFGTPTTLPWGVTFPEESFPALTYGLVHTIHPVQLYSSVNGFLLGGILLFLDRYKRFDGQIFWLFILFYATTRFILEYFRGDPGRNFIGIFSTHQFISILVFGLAVWMLVRLPRTQR